jgi:hypothetical protein
VTERAALRRIVNDRSIAEGASELLGLLRALAGPA